VLDTHPTKNRQVERTHYNDEGGYLRASMREWRGSNMYHYEMPIGSLMDRISTT
jgi:hypothetical protein